MRRGGPLTILLLLLGACASSPDVAPDAAPIDAAQIDAAVIPDAAPGNFGEACTGNEDCATGFCVEGAGGGGGLCSRECADDCPADWNCRTVELPSGSVELCIPEAQYHCSRCTGDAECPGGGCLKIDGEEHCAAACASGTDCPGGYTCGADPDGTHAGMFCVPVTGSCTCDAANAGMTRTCSDTNGFGTCFGMETCNATEGWENCTARVPAAEDCDGQDDDCDFVIDDGVGGGEDCDITNANGTCTGVNTCGGVGGFVCQGPVPAAEACNFIDDNCDGATDETFTDLGDLCQDGVGACLRYGARRCNTAGTATECSAVAGPTAAEECNGIDDDCNNVVDNGFSGLGGSCTVGMGICQRTGTTICMGDGSGTECSVMPGTPSGTDSCNYADDNCNGVVDEAYTNVYMGVRVYDRNATCGSCEINCTTLYSGANASGVCSVGGTSATCQMTCNAGTADLNNSTVDGCEFVNDPTSIYVSASNGTDDPTCGLGPNSTQLGTHACKSITYGRGRAVSTGRANIKVADGTYDNSGGDAGIALVNGKNLLGGYRSDTWARHALTTADPSATVIQGYNTFAATNHQYAIDASGITTAATLVEGFVIRGPNNSLTGGNSYAVYVNGSTLLTIRSNQIRAGRGGPGGTGNAGTVGQIGTNATAPTAAYNSFTASGSGSPSWCPPSNNRQFANGGVKSCGADNVSGGNGSGNTCPAAGPPSTPNYFIQGTSCTTQFSMCNGFNGQPADPGGGAAGAGRPGGNDGRLSTNGAICTKQTGYCNGGSNNGLPCSVNGQCTGGSCQLTHPTTGLQWTQSGFVGSPGSAGGDAPGVQGCPLASQYGNVPGGTFHWAGGSGSMGATGYNGGGGGGGGAGGGAYCTAGGCFDVVGAHGGGGGSGGCGGNGGLGGSPGGAAFGIFIVGGTAPTLTTNGIESGAGGDGGRGGIAGAGGVGGNGSSGGNVGTTGIGVHCSGPGGRGGDGGMGGAGSGGGGGCGGVSYGIFTSGIGAQTYCVSQGGNNTVTTGTGGAGGAGGYSPGVSGGTGTAGVAGDCRSI